MFNLSGKRVVVSGAAGGIGAKIFLELLRAGAYPIGIDVVKGFKGMPSFKPCKFIQADASNVAAIAKIFKDSPPVYGLVNNAGMLGTDETHGGRNIKAFDKMMQAHVKTAMVLTETIAPLMRDCGSIVNIGSIETAMAAPNVVLYASAKGALHAMTIAYANTFGKKNIRVNLVSPGNVNTERNEEQYNTESGKKIIERFEKKTPLGRSVSRLEIADAVLFLLSDRSSAITGQEIVVDCGYTKALWDPGWTE